MVSGMLPVNMSAGSLHSAVSRGADQGQPNDPAVQGAQALDLKALQDQLDARKPKAEDLAVWDQENYQMSSTDALTLGFPVASIEGNAEADVILYGMSRYLDAEASGHTFRYGVAIRVILQLLNANGKVKVGIPAVAAQVELGMLEASSTLIVSGYVGNISASLPGWQSFDVKTYADYFKAVSELQKVIFDDVANMRPVLLSSTLAGNLVDSNSVQRHGILHRAVDRVFHRDTDDHTSG